MSKHLLALDVGTQSARACVFDAQGQLLARKQIPIQPYVSPQPGWAEQDPEMYWRALGQACRGLFVDGAVRPEDLAGVSLTTQRATMICLDASGVALRPATVWLDQRRCTAPPELGPMWRMLFGLAGARADCALPGRGRGELVCAARVRAVARDGEIPFSQRLPAASHGRRVR